MQDSLKEVLSRGQTHMTLQMHGEMMRASNSVVLFDRGCES